jgi:hypothetical protein
MIEQPVGAYLIASNSKRLAFGFDRKSAEDAIESLNGTVIGKNTVRLSWGRSPNKQVKFHFGVDAFYQ